MGIIPSCSHVCCIVMNCCINLSSGLESPIGRQRFIGHPTSSRLKLPDSTERRRCAAVVAARLDNEKAATYQRQISSGLIKTIILDQFRSIDRIKYALCTCCLYVPYQFCLQYKGLWPGRGRRRGRGMRKGGRELKGGEGKWREGKGRRARIVNSSGQGQNS